MERGKSSQGIPSKELQVSRKIARATIKVSIGHLSEKVERRYGQGSLRKKVVETVRSAVKNR